MEERKSVIQSTLAACCLVCREWNRIFTPILYGDILLGPGKEPLLTRSLLYRTLRHTQPAHKTLIKTITVTSAKNGSTANLLSICFIVPNLRKLILDFKTFDLSELHPNLAQQLWSLSKCCKIQMPESNSGNVGVDGWARLPIYIEFTRRSRSASCKFWAGSSKCGWYILLIGWKSPKQPSR